MAEIEEVIFQRFKGWSPYNVPPTDLFPKVVGEGELVDGRGLVVEPDGVIRWRRDQFTVPAVGQTLLDLFEYKASPAGVDKNQVLAFCTDGKLYKLETDWATATASQFAYGYQLDWDDPGNGNYAFAEVATGLQTSGRHGFCAARDVLLVGHRSQATKVWNGTSLSNVGLLPPETAPKLSTTDEDLRDPEGGYTHTDTGNYLTVTAPMAVFIVMPENCDTRHSKDFGVDHFGDFSHDFQIKISAMSAGARIVVWGVSATPDETEGNWSNGIYVRAIQAGADYLLQLRAYWGGTVSSSAISLETDYYCTVIRSGSTVYLKIFSDATRQTLIETISSWLGATPFRYLYVATSEEVGDAGDTSTGGVTAVNINEAAAGSGELPAGRYSYYVTFGKDDANGDEIWESMPNRGEPLDVVIAADKAIDLKDIPTVAGGDATNWRKVYRAYSDNIAAGVRGESFQLLCKLDDNTTTTWHDDALQSTLGLPIAFDHAIPPRGDLLVYHGDRAFMAHCACSSRSYDEYDTTGLDNVLFWSELDEPYYWPAQNYIRIGDSSPILALASWRDWLLIFKETSVWVLRGYDPDDFQTEELTARFGCTNLNAAAAAPPGVIWRDKAGLVYFDGAAVRVIREYGLGSTWGPAAASVTQPTIAFHRGKFYILEGDHLLTWDPLTDSWGYRDFNETTVGIRAFNFGRYQSHILSYCEWHTASSYLVVLDTGREFTHYDAQGSSASDLFAPVRVTLAALIARPGEEIVPLEVWIDGSWVAHATATRRPYLFLNDDADYSSTAGQNVWAATPLAPKDGKVIGVPSGYTYDTSNKTNGFTSLYIQIKATEAEDFVLNAVGLRFYRRPARGA